MKNFAVLAVISLTGFACSGGDDDSFDCERTDRNGRYLLDFSETSGDCGQADSVIVELEGADAVLKPNCVLDEPDVVSPDNCTLTRHFTCDLSGEPGAPPNASAIYAGTTEQQDESGDVITGSLTMTLVDGSTVVCRSTYAITYTRQ